MEEYFSRHPKRQDFKTFFSEGGTADGIELTRMGEFFITFMGFRVNFCDLHVKPGRWTDFFKTQRARSFHEDPRNDDFLIPHSPLNDANEDNLISQEINVMVNP